VSDDAPYRKGGPAAPSALVALASGAAARRRELPRDAASEQRLDFRIQRALDIRPMRIASVLLPTFGAFMLVDAVAGGTVAIGIAGVLMAAIGIAFDARLYRTARADTARRLAVGAKQPFPVARYDLWLASERPLFDVYLRGAVAQQVVVDAAAAIDVGIAIEWLDDLTFRVAIPARTIESGEDAMNGGDERAWLAFAEKILGPLHQDVGIERVEMGGSMRALAAP
jgi:hypothetical protein